ncbi:insertion element IS1016 transposase [Neisseria zoodegmatis]|uniref:Insertion element IS1016 transposase n=1 Tax=Neisseria zoodegmatis TaxID=326523 RepID=A0A378WIR8_9NEIS|nr:insertion element IS1016 transposase [Neisseria zoodegmatis]
MPDSVGCMDCLSSYDVPDIIVFCYHRINHNKSFAERQNHINDIENFWNQAKRILCKYSGINRKPFSLFLQECEFRFNGGISKQQLKILRL